MTHRVLIGPSSFGTVDLAPLRALREAGFEVRANPFGRKLSKPELQALLPGVDGLIAGLEPLDREVLEASQLKVVSRCGSGMSNLDLGTAERLGIIVKSTPDAPTTAVAELTVGAMIMLLRKIASMDSDLHQGRWAPRTGAQLNGKTVLVVGFGRVGRKVANLLAGFGASCLAVDPVSSQKDVTIPRVTLEEGLKRADIITLHASGETELLGAREFALMRPGVFILNAARGGLIDTSVLCRALDEGLVAGAWLDTFASEPYAGPLSGYSQVLLTPHVGSATVECRRQMEMEAVENLLSAFQEIERRDPIICP